MPTVRIFELYDSIQGESTLAGTPCTIIRLAGCPLRCKYCDTKQALSFSSGKERSIQKLVSEVNQRNMPLTLVTGGEPLAQEQCLPLLEKLVVSRPTIQLETSGAFDIRAIHPQVCRILDIKTPGGGEENRNLWRNLEHLHAGDEIKFVLVNRGDYIWALDIIRQFDLARLGIPLLFSPMWDSLDLKDLAQWLVQDRAPARLQLQTHKVIWGPEATCV